ncbi:hypothetical protein B9T31_16075, partial [Acinetobacter sp. ANC 4558]|uniref:phage tail fiber domain-containing protein n=1 Tax=Acinetobacter sp. ANC 4558 TaxID=1977876 RepID=UPI000B705152
MAVHEQTPYIEYKANGTTTNFVLPFACKGKDHLIVTVNDLDTDAEDWGFIDNEVKFKYPPFQDSIIKIWRNTPIERRSTFRTFDNSLRPETLNIDLDTLWLVMQELNVRNQVSDKRLQELMGSLVEGQINGLPSEILARISGDELSKLLISIEQNRANKAEILLQNEKASKLELSNGLAPKADKTYVDQRVIDGKEYDQTFDTEAELRAYTPIKIGFLAKAWDTRKVFRYVAGVEKWKDLGLSEKDLANQYTDEKSQQLSQKINDIQTLDFYTKEAQQHQWQGLDGVGNILIAVDAEGNFQQNYHYDFHIKPESPSFQIVDRNLNLIFGNSDLYLRDFFTKKNEIAFITVDQNFNILNSNNQQDTDLDFSELNYSALNPNALKNKEPYLNYSKLCVQQDFTDDL